jgi:ABC-2 type transport system ATP-binding protein
MNTAREQTRLELRGIRRSFGERAVLRGVDLRVQAGQILGLLGPNGAGKSTLISIADGTLTPDSGSVTVDGIDLLAHREAAASVIGSAPQSLGIYPTLSLQENVRAFARLHGLKGSGLRARCTEVIESLGLASSARLPAEHLSGGQKRRLHLAMALTHEPRLLFLDEPTVGADVESRQQILDLVRRIADGGTAVVYTTHYLHELEQLPARIALLHDGLVEDLGAVDDVVQAQGGAALRVRVTDDARPPTGWLRDGEWLFHEPTPISTGELLASLVTGLGERTDVITDVQLTRPTLESAYLRILQQREPRPASRTEVHDAAA